MAELMLAAWIYTKIFQKWFHDKDSALHNADAVNEIHNLGKLQPELN